MALARAVDVGVVSDWALIARDATAVGLFVADVARLALGLMHFVLVEARDARVALAVTLDILDFSLWACLAQHRPILLIAVGARLVAIRTLLGTPLAKPSFARACRAVTRADDGKQLVTGGVAVRINDGPQSSTAPVQGLHVHTATATATAGRLAAVATVGVDLATAIRRDVLRGKHDRATRAATTAALVRASRWRAGRRWAARWRRPHWHRLLGAELREEATRLVDAVVAAWQSVVPVGDSL